MSDHEPPAADGANRAQDGVGLSGLARQLGTGLASIPAGSAGTRAMRPPEGSPVPIAPPSTTPPKLAVRRMPPPAALAAADRILAAAGHDPPAADDLRTSVGPPASAPSDRVPAVVAPPTPSPAVASGPSTASRNDAPVHDAHDAHDAHDGQTVRRDSAPSLAPPVAELRLVDGRRATLRPGESVTIGRAGTPGALGIDHPEISRRHVTVRMTASGPTATDEGSTNGTSIVRDGLWHDLTPGAAIPLQPGDRLAVPDDIWLATILASGSSTARDGDAR